MSYYPIENQDKFFMHKSQNNNKFSKLDSYISLDKELNKKSDYIINKNKTDFNKHSFTDKKVEYTIGYYDFISFENEIKNKK